MGFPKRNRDRSEFVAYDRYAKTTCGICGKSLDRFHDLARCSEQYQRKCDDEARKPKGGQTR